MTLAFAAAVFVIVIEMRAFAQESAQPKYVECYEGNELIFSSEAENIDAFDASKYGVDLIHTEISEDQSTVIYVFGPRPIVCTEKS